MTRNRLLLSGLKHYWRSHVAVALGTAIAVAVLAGALIVGDSVRASLKAMTLNRLGGVDYAMTVSCYQPDGNGRACGRCDSCRLRREGFAAAGLSDPTRYR